MEKTHAVYSTKTKIVRLIIWLFLALAAIITIFPVCYVIFGSFKDNKELLVGGSSILPSKWVFDNYVQAWKQANFATYTMNSVFLSLAVMLISLINASMAGYVFARKNFKGKELLYMLFVAFMFINVGSVSLRPLFELAVKLKMNKSLLALQEVVRQLSSSYVVDLLILFLRSLTRRQRWMDVDSSESIIRLFFQC